MSWLPMLAILGFALASVGTAVAATEHVHDPYVIEGPSLADPTRADVPSPSGQLGIAATRAARISDDAAQLGFAGAKLPLHRTHSLGLTHSAATFDAERASREIVEQHPALAGVTEGDLELWSVKESPEITYVHFRQLVAGHPVYNSRVGFQWDREGRLRLSGSDVYVEDLANPSFSTHAIQATWMEADEARAAALDGFPADVVVSKWEFEEKVWYPIRSESPSGFRLVPVWRLQFQTESPVGRYHTIVDGETGVVLARESRLHHDVFEGSVVGQVEPNTAGDEYETLVMRDQYVSLRKDATEILETTDADGVYSADVDPGTYTATMSMAGKRIVIVDAANGNNVPIVENEVEVPGSFDFQWTFGNSADSWRDAYYHGNVAYQYMREIDGSEVLARLDDPMPTRVDDPSGSCNAYWNGTLMNFYAGGGNCPSGIARIADVVYHEYGHAITEWTYWPDAAPGDQHEGFSDYFAATIRDNPVIGLGFFGPDAPPLRSCENDRTLPAAECQGEVHCVGEVMAAALWDLRVVLGRELTDDLFHFGRYGHSQSYHDYMLDVLVYDDDDGDLTNGSPHFDEIIAAFAPRGIGDYSVHILAPMIPDIETPGETIPVTLNIWSLTPLDPSSLALYASIDDGATYERYAVRSTETSREYSVKIPAPDLETRVLYYWVAANDQYDAVLPEGAPGETYSFYVGADHQEPAIDHLFPTAMSESFTRVYVRAGITDNSQRLDRTLVEYKVGSAGELHEVDLVAMEDGDTYEALIEVGSVAPGEDLYYRIIASDMAVTQNTGQLPAEDFARVPIRAGQGWDFETSPGDFTTDSIWEWGEPLDRDFAYSGTHAWGTDLDDPYGNEQSSELIWGPIDLSGFERARLQFRTRYKIEGFWDGGNVSVSTDPLGRWSVMQPVQGYPYGNVFSLDREPGYSGEQAFWSDELFPLDFQIGSEIYVRLRFVSDSGLVDKGWFFDDLMIVEAQAWVDPRDFMAQDGEDGIVSLSWNLPAGIDVSSSRFIGYNLYRAAGDEPMGEAPINSEPITDRSYIDTTVDNGTFYSYRLTAVYDDGESAGAHVVAQPFAASVGLSTTSLGMVLDMGESEQATFSVHNAGSGRLEFDIYAIDHGQAIEDVRVRYGIDPQGPQDPVVVATDPEDNTELIDPKDPIDPVDLKSLTLRQFEFQGFPLLEVTIEGHQPWGDPTADWGGILFIDTDGDLSTSQEGFNLGWGEGFNMGYEWGVIFGNLPAQVGLGGGTALLFDAGRTSEPQEAPISDFPVDGTTISFTIPLPWLGPVSQLQVATIASRAVFSAPVDYMPDLPMAAYFLERTPNHGQSVNGSNQTVDVVFDSQGAPVGIHRIDFVIDSNDSNNPDMVLPMTVQVTPPPLQSLEFESSQAGIEVSIVPNEAMPPQSVAVQRREVGTTEWSDLASELPPGSDGSYYFLDQSVRTGRSYEYQFPFDFGALGHFDFSAPVVTFEVDNLGDLQASSLESSFTGLVVQFIAPEGTPFVSADIERTKSGEGSWTKVNEDPVQPEGRTFTYLDEGVSRGESYDYRFALQIEDGAVAEYGPFSATYESLFPAALADLQFKSQQDGIGVSFTMPEQLQLIEGTWISRRAVGAEDWTELHEDGILPDESGTVGYLDRWSVEGLGGVQYGNEYEYRIRIVATADASQDYLPEKVEFTPEIPLQVELHPAAPNPFVFETTIRFGLPQEANVQLEVFDANGRRKVVLKNETMSAGIHSYLWNGKDGNGNALTSGVYWARLKTPSKTTTIRIVRTR